jgi:hypothetical protein
VIATGSQLRNLRERRHASVAQPLMHLPIWVRPGPPAREPGAVRRVGSRPVSDQPRQVSETHSRPRPSYTVVLLEYLTIIMYST